ncbi:unnamed protein product [Colias eurytheme]|nr:unnamed protein product [Colias eurytheme]
MSYDLKDKVVFLTGGAIGIGAESVKLFLEEGVKHIAVTDIDENAGKQLEDELNSTYPGRISFIKCDVTKDEELFAAYDQVLKENEYIDLVINNAALMNDSPKVYKKAIEVNVTALVTSTLKAWEFMRKDKSGRGGSIVNISSIAGLVQAPFMPVYHATKSAVIQFSNCLGAEQNYARTGVKVFTVCYGPTNTSLISNQKLHSFSDLYPDVPEIIKKFPVQRVESAAKGLIQACKQGESASTWLVINDRDAHDVTPGVKKAYTALLESAF